MAGPRAVRIGRSVTSIAMIVISPER
jgi:hypothetical protein